MKINFDKEYFSNVKVVAYGTFFDRAILIVSSIILAWLYSPQEFAIFAIYSSILSIIHSLGALKYDTTIITNKNFKKLKIIIQDSFTIVFFIFLASCIVSFFLFFLFTAINLETSITLHILLPLNVIFSNSSVVYQQYAIRKNELKIFNNSKIIHSFAFSVLAIFFSYILKNELSLVYAYFISFIASYAYFYLNFKIIFNLKKINFKRFFFEIKKRKDLIIYDSFGSSLNTLSNELPVFFLGFFYGQAILGYYAMVLKIVNVPITILMRSVGTINFKYVSLMVNKKKPIFKYMYKLIIILFSITIVPIFISVFFGEEIFSIILGEKWSYSGIILSLLCISFAIKFISLTLLETAYSIKIVKILSLWKIFSVLATLISFLYFGRILDDFYIFHMLNFLEIFIYGTLLIMILTFSKRFDDKL